MEATGEGVAVQRRPFDIRDNWNGLSTIREEVIVAGMHRIPDGRRVARAMLGPGPWVVDGDAPEPHILQIPITGRANIRFFEDLFSVSPLSRYHREPARVNLYPPRRHFVP